jgi:endonuclease YncB( thermonuclease family)
MDSTNNNVYFNILDLPCYKSLACTDEKSLDYFSFKGKTFIAKPCHFYDGDTFSAIFESNGQIIKYRCRCIGYDCAEIKPHVADKSSQVQLDAAAKEKQLAQAAKKRFIELVTAHPSGLCLIQCDEFDKYGRLLVTVFNGIQSESINSIMIKESFGKAYDGGTKEKWDV